MLKDISRTRLIGAWCAAVVVIGACGVVAGIPVTVSFATLLLAIGLMPPAILLLLWRGAPPPTIAELLYSVDTPSKDGR
jgi:hypothetical protein